MRLGPEGIRIVTVCLSRIGVAATTDTPDRPSDHRSDPLETPGRSNPPTQDRAAWIPVAGSAIHSEGRASSDA